MNDVNAIRTHLFNAIEGVKNGSLSIEKAKAITEISQVIVNSAKVEVDYAKATSGKVGSGFLPDKPAIPGVTTHRLQG